jgi:hypothetical protein
MNYKKLGRLLRGGGRSSPLAAAAPSPAGAELPPKPAAMMSADAPAPTAAARTRPVDTLLARLDACADDSERAALLAIAPDALRDDLSAALAYRVMVTLPPDVGLDALVAALHGAADNAERAAVLNSAALEQRTALAEHLRWRTVPVDNAQRYYLSLIE